MKEEQKLTVDKQKLLQAINMGVPVLSHLILSQEQQRLL